MLKRKLPGLLVAIFGIIALVAGIVMNNQQKTYTPTNATVTDERCEAAINRNDDDTYYYTLKYEVDGETYTGILSFSSDGYDVGDTMAILYNPNDPSTITNDDASAPIYFIIVGPIVFILGIAIFLFRR